MTTFVPEASAARRHGVFHPLTVEAVERLTDDAVAVTFAVPDELRADYRFAAGQHLTVRTEIDGAEVRRNYSICAPAVPVESQRLRIAVKRLDGGAFSAYVNASLRPGDVLDVMTPTGRFSPALDPGHAKRYVAVAAGSGITPVLSILASVLAAEPASRCTLVYGNRTVASVMFLEELADLKDRYADRFDVLHVLSREAADVDVRSGRIDADRLERLTASLLPVDDVDDWYLCGPFAMVSELRDWLLARGVPAARVHVELFHVEGEAPREAGRQPEHEEQDASVGTSAVTIRLDGRSSTFDVPRSGPRILDAALAVRPDAPYACKGGVCGTCRALVVEGEVRMDRNYALEDDERARGFVLACQSHPVSDVVVLDFDA